MAEGCIVITSLCLSRGLEWVIFCINVIYNIHLGIFFCSITIDLTVDVESLSFLVCLLLYILNPINEILVSPRLVRTGIKMINSCVFIVYTFWCYSWEGWDWCLQTCTIYMSLKSPLFGKIFYHQENLWTEEAKNCFFFSLALNFKHCTKRSIFQSVFFFLKIHSQYICNLYVKQLVMVVKFSISSFWL